MNVNFKNAYNHLECINIICNYGTKIKDVLDMFSNKIGKNKNQFRFTYKLENLDYNDERKIEDILFDFAKIEFIEK